MYFWRKNISQVLCLKFEIKNGYIFVYFVQVDKVTSIHIRLPIHQYPFFSLIFFIWRQI